MASATTVQAWLALSTIGFNSFTLQFSIFLDGIAVLFNKTYLCFVCIYVAICFN